MAQYSVYTQSKWDELHPSIEPTEEPTVTVTPSANTDENNPNGTTAE